MSESKALNNSRLSRRAVLENAKQAGFRPGSIIDVGFAMGTESLFDVFEGTRNLLIEPVAEMEPVMAKFCAKRPGSTYLVAAASDAPGAKTMVVRRSVTGSSFHGSTKVEDALQREVPTVTLDQVVVEQGLPGPYLIKIDVEGHELHILRGAERCLAATEMVMTEVTLWNDEHPRGRASLMDQFRFLEDHDFVLYDIIEPAYRPIDGALYVFDGVFVKRESPLRQVRSFRNRDQYAETGRARKPGPAPSPARPRRTNVLSGLTPQRLHLVRAGTFPSSP